MNPAFLLLAALMFAGGTFFAVASATEASNVGRGLGYALVSVAEYLLAAGLAHAYLTGV